MSETAWYRSLYWRIGVGFVVCLAVVLAIQALAIVWFISRMEVAPGPPPPIVIRLVAVELTTALETDPRLDIESFLRERYGELLPPVVAVMTDGRVASSDGSSPPPGVLQRTRARLRDAAGLLPPVEARPGRGLMLRRQMAMRMAAGGAIVIDDRVAGLVVGNPRSPYRQLAPMLGAIGVVLVVAGTATAALLIFGPVRRRLRSLEDAARKVGAGDLAARASEDGGDEVAALARTFNRMTSDLAERARQLEGADRARRLLLADVSHELMTPLTAMRGYIETLAMQNRELDVETRTRYLGVISDETVRLEHVVGDLLDLARLEGGRDKLDVQDIPIEVLFGRVVSRHEREAEAKGVTLSTSIDPGAEIACGDPMRLEQALQNLAANALRHTPRGGRVELTAVLREGELVLSVSDTGAGIAPEYLPFVFDRFYKADPARGAGSNGSGLGLSIVKAIVEKHGGRITVESKVGEGTTITVYLPNT